MLLAQFPLLEETLTTLGIAVWPMVEFEADDALAAAAAKAAADPHVDVDDLRSNGPTPAFSSLAAQLDAAVSPSNDSRLLRTRTPR